MAQNKEELLSRISSKRGGWKHLITNPNAWEKVGEDRLLRFLESCLTLKYDSIDFAISVILISSSCLSIITPPFL